jgi:transposase
MMSEPISQPQGPFELCSRALDGLPIVAHFLARMRVGALLERYLPDDDARLRVTPARAVGVVVANVCLGREPLYGLGEWAGRFEPGPLGLAADQGAALNDDRAGRALGRLFDADRASLLTELMLGVIAEFSLDLSQLHNDSTSITFSGAYAQADGRARGGKPTPEITFGHNKDHRPDLKQLLWVLTVTADEAVPIAYRTAPGNTTDDQTHVATWDGLVALRGGDPDFLYVADSKLCTREAMGHIAARGGRFVTVLPRSRKEDAFFRDWAQTHAPDWVEAARRPARRQGDPDHVWSTVRSPICSAEGHRIVWVHSSDKHARDADARQARIEKAIKALQALSARVASPKSRLRTRVAVEQAASATLADTGAARWVRCIVTETTEERFRQEKRGRPGTGTRYRKLTKTRFSLSWQIDAEKVAYDARTDGCFPLISNDTTPTDAELLAAYRYQPNLEKRHAQLKGVQLVAPVLLKDPARIEGLLCCYFIALLCHALIEREIRHAMTKHAIDQLALYHEQRPCHAPTAARVLEQFTGLSRHHLLHQGRVIQTFDPALTPLQRHTLDLLSVPHSAYTTAIAT